MSPVTFPIPESSRPMVLPGSRYAEDEGHPSSLLNQTCWEQFGRLHTLDLLSSYLSAGAGCRKRAAIVQEQKALRELYEAIWYELRCAFPSTLVEQARNAVELLVEEDSHAKPTQHEVFLNKGFSLYAPGRYLVGRGNHV